jgi:predicted protein tyrosine phosphatase
VHDYALIELDEVLLHWADEIVVVEPYLKAHIPEAFHHKTIVLNVPDSYGYMDENLQAIIKEQYEAS